jgi:hypothetical protein
MVAYPEVLGQNILVWVVYGRGPFLMADTKQTIRQERARIKIPLPQ